MGATGQRLPPHVRMARPLTNRCAAGEWTLKFVDSGKEADASAKKVQGSYDTTHRALELTVGAEVTAKHVVAVAGEDGVYASMLAVALRP
jgi:hypothetical protein